MIPRRALEKAFEHGWRPEHKAQFLKIAGDTHYHDIQIGDHVAFDPSFWKCLGKALGWPNPDICEHDCGYMHFALQFVRLILTGADTKPFWDELLTPIEE